MVDLKREVIFNEWWKLIRKELECQTFVKHKENGKLSRQWYRGEEFFSTKNKTTDWDGTKIRGNLWQRDYDILINSTFSRDPRLSITPSLSDERNQKASAAYDALVRKIWRETNLRQEIKRALRRAGHDNVSYLKLHWDPFRLVPTLLLVEGDVVYDSSSNWNPKRARWCAEVIKRPLVDIFHDDTFPLEKRKKLLLKVANRLSTKNGDLFTANSLNSELMDTEVNLAHIYSKVGDTPWVEFKERKLIVLAEEMKDDPLLITDWDWNFLDADEFPIIQLKLKDVDGEAYGVTIFETLKPLFEFFNWAASFNLEHTKRAATQKIAVNEQALADTDQAMKLESGKHLEVINVQGSPREVLEAIELGKTSDITLQTMQLAKSLHDEQSGITEVVRGQSPGDRTTAEEVRLLDKNAAIVFQEVSTEFDDFLNDVVRILTLACLHLIPQWSRVVTEDGVKERFYVEQPVVDELGQPIGVELVAGFADIGFSELQDLPSIEGLLPGHILRPGVDAWIGVEHALNYIEYDLDQLKRDFAIEVEAGSARATSIIEDQRNALTMLQTLLPIYQQIGAFPQIHELLKRFIESFRVRNADKLIPDIALFSALLPIQDPQLNQNDSTGSGNNNQDNASPLEQPPIQNLGGRNNGLGLEPSGPVDALRGSNGGFQ